ncbi:MAG: hypothetical protein HWD61_00665 [Parachlamydiaceae bacterium]|nr:MAG: hypothetical protein HWD61_00665 [Parachlamydiaceae bacterium]
MIDEFHQGLLDALEFLKDSGVRQRIIKHRESILGVLDMKFPFKFKRMFLMKIITISSLPI